MAKDIVPDTHNIDDIWAMIVAGEAQLWPAEDGALLTNIITFPRQPPVLNNWLSGGKLKTCLRLIDEAEAWARLGSFTHLIACGRREWGRVYHNGAEEKYTVFSKELT